MKVIVRSLRLAHFILLALLIATLSCVLLSQGRGGGAGGGGGARGGAAGAQRGAGGTRGPGAPRGSGARGERRGQIQRQELTPDNGLVTTYVTVTDREGRAVPGLTRRDFKVYEDDVEQTLEAFSIESGPITAGFVVGGDPSEFRGIAPAFLKATPWNEEYFVLVDTGRPPGGTVIQSFTTDAQKAPKNFVPGGVTPDSIYVGIDYMKEAANRRKLLLLFGGSLSTEDGPRNGLDPYYVVRMATREGVQVYSILTSGGDGTFDDGGASDIAPLTGGRNYIATTFSSALESRAEEIARNIAVQYFIGYHTTNPEKDGKFRRIKVSVSAPEDLGRLSVRSRSGYYAEKEKKPKG